MLILLGEVDEIDLSSVQCKSVVLIVTMSQFVILRRNLSVVRAFERKSAGGRGVSGGGRSSDNSDSRGRGYEGRIGGGRDEGRGRRGKLSSADNVPT